MIITARIAENRTVALKMLQDGIRPHTVLLDVLMAGVSAETFLDIVQCDENPPHIICMSAAQIPESIANRCYASVRKPFPSVRMMLDTVRDAIKSRTDCRTGPAQPYAAAS